MIMQTDAPFPFRLPITSVPLRSLRPSNSPTLNSEALMTRVSPDGLDEDRFDARSSHSTHSGVEPEALNMLASVAAREPRSILKRPHPAWANLTTLSNVACKLQPSFKVTFQESTELLTLHRIVDASWKPYCRQPKGAFRFSTGSAAFPSANVSSGGVRFIQFGCQITGHD